MYSQEFEPRIPEEYLKNKLSYHYDKGIVRGKLYGQIKTIWLLF